ncbi:MAG: ATP-binding cassette domain-containing protein [Actinomycetota bacterium]|nr:ATP-binding cassette domain-containing protein [Actinomycetota bacterium]
MTAPLRFEGLTKVYGEGESAVEAVLDADLTVAAGELVLVMGPSGSGKTTLLAMCGALLRPTSGRVWIGGEEVTALGEKQLPRLRLRSVGFVFQGFNLLENLTALENVRIVIEAAGARKQAADRRARELLGELRLSHRLDMLPEKLSGGEKQRVAIARALANDPPLLLADEPSGNLDSRTGYQVMHMLELLAKEHGKTVVAVTHDHRIEDVADRVLWLEDGHLSDRPPDVSALATDPVCGMMISVERGAGRRVLDGTTFHLCSEICIERFDADPHSYARSATAG